jgi:hypothetical protein
LTGHVRKVEINQQREIEINAKLRSDTYSMLMIVLTQILWSLWLVSLILEKIVTWVFLSRLRRLHITTLNQLGKPVTMMPTFKFFGFLWRKDYDLLPDEQLVVIGRPARLFWLCQTVLLVMVIVLTVLFSFSHRIR